MMERKSPKRIDRGMVMEAIKSMYGEEVFKQYMGRCGLFIFIGNKDERQYSDNQGVVVSA